MSQGGENIGLAMTFTIVSHLREELTNLARERVERRKHEEAEKERKALEVRFHFASSFRQAIRD